MNDEFMRESSVIREFAYKWLVFFKSTIERISIVLEFLIR